jgi:hypothetical protein
MKAREYVKFYRAELARVGESAALVTIGRAFVDEVVVLKNARHVSSIGGFEGILREQNEKYKAFVKLVAPSPFAENGFAQLVETWLKMYYAPLWDQLCAYRARKGERR